MGGCSTSNRAYDYRLRIVTFPNRKLERESLLTDIITATPRRDTNGPTAQIKSVLKYNRTDACSGFVF